jgi:hypothetical protein
MSSSLSKHANISGHSKTELWFWKQLAFRTAPHQSDAMLSEDDDYAAGTRCKIHYTNLRLRPSSTYFAG